MIKSIIVSDSMKKYDDNMMIWVRLVLPWITMIQGNKKTSKTIHKHGKQCIFDIMNKMTNIMWRWGVQKVEMSHQLPQNTIQKTNGDKPITH